MGEPQPARLQMVQIKAWQKPRVGLKKEDNSSAACCCLLFLLLICPLFFWHPWKSSSSNDNTLYYVRVPKQKSGPVKTVQPTVHSLTFNYNPTEEEDLAEARSEGWWSGCCTTLFAGAGAVVATNGKTAYDEAKNSATEYHRDPTLTDIFNHRGA